MYMSRGKAATCEQFGFLRIDCAQDLVVSLSDSTTSPLPDIHLGFAPTQCL